MPALATAIDWTAGPAGGLVHESWGQGRSAYGGLQAAGALTAARPLVAEDRHLRSVLVDFVGPAKVGPLDVDVEVLRAGRALTRVEVRLSQEGQICAVVLASYGADRPTSVATAGPKPPPANGPEGLPEMPYLPGLTPNFTQHFAYRWSGGSVPFSGADEGHVQGWIRPREAVEMNAERLLAMLDAWPPPIWGRAKRPFPGSSVTWQANFVGLPKTPPAPDAWWFYDARTVVAADGYSDFSAFLWSADGQLVATSRQLIAEFSGGR